MSASLLRAGEWQPIETAPKDGTAILIWQPNERRSHYMPADALNPFELSYTEDDPRLLWFDDERWAIGYWRPWGGWGNRNSTDVNPTHWMPLPAPPPSCAICSAPGYACDHAELHATGLIPLEERR